jgi:hypothetical protein
MKRRLVFLPLFALLIFCLGAPVAYAQKESLQSQVLSYVGKTYGSIQDPEYISYDQALRDYMVKRIKHKFGVELDPRTYSGFDLLEIEAVLRCKKSEEPLNIFLEMFPKHQ